MTCAVVDTPEPPVKAGRILRLAMPGSSTLPKRVLTPAPPVIQAEAFSLVRSSTHGMVAVGRTPY